MEGFEDLECVALGVMIQTTSKDIPFKGIKGQQGCINSIKTDSKDF